MTKDNQPTELSADDLDNAVGGADKGDYVAPTTKTSSYTMTQADYDAVQAKQDYLAKMAANTTTSTKTTDLSKKTG